VLDAIAAAGGLLPGAGGVNLARPLTDGEQLVVSSAQPSAVAGGPVNPAAAAEAGADGRVDLNRATVAELDVLPGIGPVLAARIVAWRETAGRFERVDQLDEVSGIGPAVFADIAPLVVVR
jgi:competence protein ComEA